MNITEHLEDYRWEHPDSYGGHSPTNGYVAATLTRDSDILTESNWHCMRSIIEKYLPILTDYNEDQPDSPYDFRAGHWACGWVEYLIIPDTAPDALLTDVAEALCALSDYPILDESDFSEREFEAAAKFWQESSVSDRVAMIQDHEPSISIFAARHDYMPSDSNGALDEYLRE